MKYRVFCHLNDNSIQHICINVALIQFEQLIGTMVNFFTIYMYVSICMIHTYTTETPAFDRPIFTGCIYIEAFIFVVHLFEILS